VRFLIDAQLPPLMATVLQDHGYDAVHVSDLGLLSASDNEIWRFAIDGNWVIVSKDQDFPVRISLAKGQGRPAPHVVWIRSGNSRNRALLHSVRSIWSSVKYQLDKANVGESLVVEVRGND
jgi:predicted nuclease of predicted toxin-antitoxin system